MKACTKCHEVKPLEQFFARRGASDGRMSACKACKQAATARWVDSNRARINELAMQSYHRQKRGPKFWSTRRAYKARKTATDPMFALRERMGRSIRRGLVTGKGGRSWRSMVDYTLDELRAHIERQFLPGMSWANAREWHLDHIVPMSSFDLCDPQQFARCWGLPNLRPLWGGDNLKKSNRRETLL